MTLWVFVSQSLQSALARVVQGLWVITSLPMLAFAFLLAPLQRVVFGRKEHRLRLRMAQVHTYAEWSVLARKHDESNLEAARWKRTDETDLLDYNLIRERQSKLQQLLLDGDAVLVAKELATGLRRGLGNINNPELYSGVHCAFGTKNIVQEYNNTVVRAIQFVSASPLSFAQKEQFLRNTVEF